MVWETARDSDASEGASAASPVPGFVIVWSGAGPALAAHRLDEHGLTIGRDLAGVSADDEIATVKRLLDGTERAAQATPATPDDA